MPIQCCQSLHLETFRTQGAFDGFYINGLLKSESSGILGPWRGSRC